MMYIGKYGQDYYSFATAPIQSNCMSIGNGKFEWNGIDGSATGSSCAAARQAYCNRYGKDGKCYGDIGGPPHDNPAIPSQQSKAPAAGRTPSSGGGGGGGPGGCTPRACPPPGNKGDIIGYWNQASCQFGNMTCHALPDWGFSVIAGLGGVLVLALLLKKR